MIGRLVLELSASPVEAARVSELSFPSQPRRTIEASTTNPTQRRTVFCMFVTAFGLDECLLQAKGGINITLLQVLQGKTTLLLASRQNLLNSRLELLQSHALLLGVCHAPLIHVDGFAATLSRRRIAAAGVVPEPQRVRP